MRPRSVIESELEEARDSESTIDWEDICLRQIIPELLLDIRDLLFEKETGSKHPESAPPPGVT